MSFLMMVAVNCKRYLKDYKNIIMMFLVPVLCLGLVNHLGSNDRSTNSVNVAMLNLDKGAYSEKLIKDLNVTSVYYNKKSSLEDLKNYKNIAIYEIPSGFSSNIQKGIKPKIKAYKIENGNMTAAFEANLEQKISIMVKTSILQRSGIISTNDSLLHNYLTIKYTPYKGLLNESSLMSVVLLLFLLMGFSSNFATDLITLKNSKILERFLSTKNSGYKILGSIYVSMLVTQTLMYGASFIAIRYIFGYNFGNFGMLLLNIALISMVSISLIIMLVRLVKDAPIASLMTNMISMIIFFIFIASMVNTKQHLLVLLSKFTPLYWAVNSVEKSIIFPNTLVLILFSLVFFSAGSIRYSKFAKN